MSQSQVTFTDKVSNGGATNSGKFLHSDANELKSIINSNSTDSQQRLSSLELAIDDMVPAIAIDAAERKALTGGIVGATRIIQSDTLGIIWNLVAEDATLDSSWIGQPYTTDPDGDIVINMELADMSGIVPDLNVLGQVNGRVTLGDGVTVGGNDINTTFVSIVNKEAAYALTDVAVGTVYKTEDTGQILERTAKLDLAADFVIVGNAAGMMGVTLAGTYSADTVGQNNPPFSDVGSLGFYCNENSSGNNMSVTYESGKWIIKGSMQAFESVGGEAHPADVVTWTALTGATGTVDSVTINEPRNWKHDGTILVYDNDEKILLTNLPDGQQVKIVGEGGRIEQLPPSPLPDIKRGFIISDAGNPRSSVSDGGSSVSGAFFWHETDGQFVREDESFTPWSYYNAFIYHDGSRWKIGYQMGYFFQSDLCASTVHPADATGWTAYDAGGGIGQGTIADGALVKTRACEVYDSPQYETSGNSLWFTIKNTVYLTVNDAGSSGGYDVNGVTVANGAVQGIGWVQVGESISQTIDKRYKVMELDGHTVDTATEAHYLQTTPTTLIVPDIFPSGALVTVTNNA